MKIKAASEQEAKLGQGLKRESDKARYRNWRMRAGVLLGLLCFSVTVGSARGETIRATNASPITTPDSGVASLYPSTVSFSGVRGTITSVRVTLNYVSHSFPDDYDILLVGPGGQSAILMSDSGGDHNTPAQGLTHCDVTLTDLGTLPLPDADQITTGGYRPTNYSVGGNPNDTFPPNAARAYSSSLTVFNKTSPNGTWSLYVVDDAAGDTGTIAGGWTLELDTTAYQNTTLITVPESGPAAPYTTWIDVHGVYQGAPGYQTIRKVRVSFDISHTFPDDLDIMLIGPAGFQGGPTAVVMSDVGGGGDVSNLVLTLDDAAANTLPDNGPLVDGTFQPTNIGTDDTFPAPALPPGNSALSVFDGIDPHGLWRLHVVDDQAGDEGIIASWTLDFDFEPTALANISTRLRVETGDNVLIGGFIVTGTDPKKVIVRAIGPSVPLPGVLANPTLELRDRDGALIRFNDDWRVGSQGYLSQETEIQATGLAPTNNSESALIATLPAGGASYTAIVRGANNSTGNGVVEAYDLDRTVDSKLANISTRGLVQTGDNVMIAGTIVQGALAQRVIVRALGPSVPLAGTLANPTLELRDQWGQLLVENDDWKNGGQESDLLVTGLFPANDLESAIVLVLPVGSYTAIVRGLNGTTGVALVEVYALD
jgi:subtilisin-like proprotein convertase family protein